MFDCGLKFTGNSSMLESLCCSTNFCATIATNSSQKFCPALSTRRTCAVPSATARKLSSVGRRSQEYPGKRVPKDALGACTLRSGIWPLLKVRRFQIGMSVDDILVGKSAYGLSCTCMGYAAVSHKSDRSHAGGLFR